MTSFLLNETVALDAGSLGYYRLPAEQAKVRHVVISHTHIDHIASLPIYLENAYEATPDCATIYGSADVLDSLQRDVLNDRVWPDFVRLSPPNAPFVRLSQIEAYKPFELDGLRFTPIPVDHVVPTFGFIVEDGTSAVVFPSDTGPTDEIWKYANQTPNVKAVFLEVTFPNSMSWLADVSKHLIPSSFATEAAKLQTPANFYAVHIKARFRTQVVDELMALKLPNVDVARPGHTYQF
ncbi:MAG: MBL fold metallo-hydrolase [Gemmataceae bacterium]